MRLKWNDTDRRWGPFLFARNKGLHTTAILLTSSEGEYPCRLRISVRNSTLLIRLPDFLLRAKSTYRDGRWELQKREYGFNIFPIGGYPPASAVYYAYGTKDYAHYTMAPWSWVATYRDLGKHIYEYTFRDFDGEVKKAYVTEITDTWTYGTGMWKFLSLLRKPHKRHFLEAYFPELSGRKLVKNAAIDIQEGETVESAFRTYGTAHGMQLMSIEVLQ